MHAIAATTRRSADALDERPHRRWLGARYERPWPPQDPVREPGFPPGGNGSPAKRGTSPVGHRGAYEQIAKW